MAFFFFSKKKSVQFPIGNLLKVDIHSHILPGIDDGAPNEQTSLTLILGLAEMGFETLIGTPHVMADIHTNTRDTIQAAYMKLQAHLLAHPGLPKLHYAAEYMMDEGLAPLIKQQGLLTYGATQYVLVETPYLYRPLNLETYLFQLLTAGYTPILAHPERYHYLTGNPKEYEKLKALGFAFQVNLLSLVGYYGKQEKQAATWLLQAGLVDFLGTDLHHERHLRHLRKFTVEQQVVNALESGNFRNEQLLENNNTLQAAINTH
ncbi:tyrosine-protein phosphatase [Parapedobacter tibetensis]|uniref:tyrosine-protein phosphatase n=1 Tax=Parapedobacter tibetensis TaxID=2972951 RepID=UPI00214DB4FE|nr:CpsB/CapC family capsule biosynthesis tyrosine phosphatase [Parapedobacter tibetensis]